MESETVSVPEGVALTHTKYYQPGSFTQDVKCSYCDEDYTATEDDLVIVLSDCTGYSQVQSRHSCCSHFNEIKCPEIVSDRIEKKQNIYYFGDVCGRCKKYFWVREDNAKKRRFGPGYNIKCTGCRTSHWFYNALYDDRRIERKSSGCVVM